MLYQEINVTWTFSPIDRMIIFRHRVTKGCRVRLGHIVLKNTCFTGGGGLCHQNTRIIEHELHKHTVNKRCYIKTQGYKEHNKSVVLKTQSYIKIFWNKPELCRG